MQRKGNYKIWEDKLGMMVQCYNPALGRQGQELQTWGQHDLTYTHTKNKKWNKTRQKQKQRLRWNKKNSQIKENNVNFRILLLQDVPVCDNLNCE